MGNDHQMATTMQVGGGGGNVVVPAGGEMASNQSSQELDRLQDRDHPARSSNKEREGLRASQSFDESVSQGSILPTFHAKLLRAQIPKVQKKLRA